MSAKTNGLCEGKIKKGLTGAGGLITQAVLSIWRKSDEDGKHAYAVEFRCGTSNPSSSRCKMFRFDHPGLDDDATAQAMALGFAISTDEVQMFRTFMLEESSGVGHGSSADSEDDGDVDEFSRGISQNPRILESREESSERQPVAYVCLRKNMRVGLIFAVVMASVKDGRHRTISFQIQRRHSTHEDAYLIEDKELLNKTLTFLRGIAFESWKKNRSNPHFLQMHQPGAQLLKRGLKHSFSYVGVEEGEMVDCTCGKNQSKGLMVACEECGVWEHAECLGYRFDSQIPVDYVCSACVRAQKEEVVFIRLDEQGINAIQSSNNMPSISKERRYGNEAVCCICGCEDNEDIESMIHPCSCGGGLAFAHPNCVLLALESAFLREEAKHTAFSLPCPLCGGQGIVLYGSNGAVASSESGKTISPPKPVTLKRNSRRPSNTEQSSRGVKRLRSALVQPRVERKEELSENALLSSVKHESERQTIHSGEKVDIVPAESIKPEVIVLGRRFTDAAVTVPIKKRRIQLMEAIRSPSPPPRSPYPSPQTDGMPVKDGKEMADDKELHIIQNTGIAESGLLEDVEGIRSNTLEAESRNVKTELIKEQTNYEKEGKEKLGESPYTRGQVMLPFAHVKCVKQGIKGTLTEELETLASQFDAEACKHVIMLRESDNELGSYSSKDLQDPQVSNTAFNILEVSRHNCNCEETPLWMPETQVDFECWKVEEGAKNVESRQELHGKIKKCLSMDSLAAVAKLEEQLCGPGRCSEITAAGKDEQHVSTKHNHCTGEHCHETILLGNRDDRSHWDLNMDMEAWERPCVELSDINAPLAKVETSSPMLIPDSHEDVEVMALSKDQDVTRDGVADAKNLISEATQEKLITQPSKCLEISPAAKHVSSFMPFETGITEMNPLLETNYLVTTARTSIGSEDFNQSNAYFQQLSSHQDEKREDDYKGEVVKSARSFQDGLLTLERSSEANGISNGLKEVEGRDHSKMDDIKELQLLSSVSFTIDIAEDILGHAPTESVTSTFMIEGAVDTSMITNVPIDIWQHGNNLDVGLNTESDTADYIRDSKIKPQDDSSKNVSNNITDVKVNFKNSTGTGEKKQVLETDAFEEDEQDANSPESFGALPEEEDKQGAFGKVESSDWDEGLGEDVDYGDSENEHEQGHVDSDTCNLEVDESSSSGSQEAVEFEDDQIENHDAVQFHTDEQGQSVHWVNLGDDLKLDAGHMDQYNMNVDMEIPLNVEDDKSQPNTSNSNPKDNADIKDSQLWCEELAENVENVKKYEESGEYDNQCASDALPCSMKTTEVRTKSSGWDQLPEGFKKAKDALRVVMEDSVRNNQGASQASTFSRARRGSSLQVDAGLKYRGRTNVSGRSRIDDTFVPRFTSSRDFGREGGRGRVGSSVALGGRSRVDTWADTTGGTPSQWVPKRHSSRFVEISAFAQHGQANAAAIAAAKLESSGFLVAPDGTITKAVNAGNALRGAPRPFPGGSGGVIFNSGREAVGIGEMNLGSRSGMGLERGFGFGPGMRGNVGMDTGMCMNMGANPGIKYGGPGCSGLSNRGAIERYRFPPCGVGNRMNDHFLSRPVLENSEKWNRKERHLSPASLKLHRSSPSSRFHRRSRSRSRTKSRSQTPPRSCVGVTGNFLRRSRSPPHVRSVVKRESRESSPIGPHSIPPKFSLPPLPPPARGQRSSPTGLKRLSDRRVGDKKHPVDLEPAKMSAQPQTSPRRLASCIEQTALMSSWTGRDRASMDSSVKVIGEVQRSLDVESRDNTTHIARKGETRLKDVFRMEKGGRDRRADEGFHKRNSGREGSRRDFRTSNHSKHLSNKEDEVAPRRRRAPS